MNFPRCGQPLALCLQQGHCSLLQIPVKVIILLLLPEQRSNSKSQRLWRHLENIFQYMVERKEIRNDKACYPKSHFIKHSHVQALNLLPQMSTCPAHSFLSDLYLNINCCESLFTGASKISYNANCLLLLASLFLLLALS